MRTAFIERLTELARQDSRIMLVVGDLGYNVVDDFRRELPDQFVNAGVAEQDMTGIAAGLALSGRVVFTYSIANFPTLRTLEQIRNDVCYHGLNVKIVSVGAGYSYGPLGYSHHALEDVAVMRSLPNITVLSPADPVEASHATSQAAGIPGPFYLRLGKAGEPRIHDGSIRFDLGRAIQVRDGRDVTVIATGPILATALDSATHLADRGIECRVLSMHTIKPIDVDAVATAAAESDLIVTVEEHSSIGGLGSAVAEVLSGLAGRRPLLSRCAAPDVPITSAGSQEYLRAHAGLSPTGLADRIERSLATARTPK